MKILYLDCAMGAAGDMLTAALLELLPNPEAFIEQMNALGLPGVLIKRKRSVKCGIEGTYVSVTVDGIEEESLDYNDQHEHNHDHDNGHDHNHHDHHSQHEHSHSHHQDDCHTHSHEHAHRRLQDIEHIVRDHLPLSDKIKDDVMAVYSLIAEAESHVHGVPVSDIHFHEVGTMDAVADITAVCLLMDKLAPDEVVASPVHVGSGQVKCAHGILPVPAPATAYILRDVPIYGGHIRAELCTPTGAALLKYFADRFGPIPPMTIKAIGYGMGTKDFSAVNCVRALLGESKNKTDVVLELSCNVDDMTAEQIGFAIERLFECGALDVYTIPIGMKKSRPGTLLCTICKNKDKERIIESIFLYTSTIGIRQAEMHRYELDRTVTDLDTPYGIVRRKDSGGYGVTRSKYEYEDLSRIAKERDISIADAIALIEKKNNATVIGGVIAYE
ncbi:MAG TPA: nickel pincer cofactor biosynthesis protein LarC [Clostridiaceae bacterium]|nr:nickel pincer cofactor biosynthesis protein LarC [Clostridiaceae bacterium]